LVCEFDISQYTFCKTKSVYGIGMFNWKE
jgi:hypothetical protein